MSTTAGTATAARSTRPARSTASDAARALHDLDDALLTGAERLLITLDPSEPGSSAVLQALRTAVGPSRVTTRPAGASVLVDVALDAA